MTRGGMTRRGQKPMRAERWSPRRRGAVILAILTATIPLRGQARRSPAEVGALLERQTQELMHSIATGNRDPWQRYVHDDIVYAAKTAARNRRRNYSMNSTLFQRRSGESCGSPGFERWCMGRPSSPTT